MFKFKPLRKILVCGTILICFNSSFIAYAKENGSVNDQMKIKNDVFTYLDNEKKSIKDFKPHYSDKIICNNELKEYDKTKNDYFSGWYKGINYKMKSYKLDLEYSNLVIKNNTAMLDVKSNITDIFENAPHIKQQSINFYKFALKKINNEWKISEVIDPQMKEINNVNDDSKNMKSNAISAFPNVDKYKKSQELFSQTNLKKGLKRKQEEDKKNKQISPIMVGKGQKNINLSTPMYHANVAALYAYKWYDSYNPEWRYFDGNDCTNFVSQCLNYAGIGRTTAWNMDYNLYERLGDYKQWYWTNSWTCVPEFYTWLMSSGVGFESNGSMCRVGDVLQFYKSSPAPGYWSHTAIITTKDYTGIYYTAHSNGIKDNALTNVYPSTTYSSCRAIGINWP